MTRDNIFISYRRLDSADAVGRMYDRLSAHYGAEHVFKDVDSIPLGANFKQCIDERIGSCRAFIAVIGPEWLTCIGEGGVRRLDEPQDFVRSEIEAALRLDIPVIPVLVRGATMPTRDQLPEAIRELALRHGMPLRADPDFHNDVGRLIQGIGPVTSRRPPEPLAAPLDLSDDGSSVAPPPPRATASQDTSPARRWSNPMARFIPNPAHRLMIGVPIAVVAGFFGFMLAWAALDMLFVDESFVEGTIYDPAVYNDGGYGGGFDEPPAFDPTIYDGVGDTEYVIAGLIGVAMIGVAGVTLFFAYGDMRLMTQSKEGAQ